MSIPLLKRDRGKHPYFDISNEYITRQGMQTCWVARVNTANPHMHMLLQRHMDFRCMHGTSIPKPHNVVSGTTVTKHTRWILMCS